MNLHAIVAPYISKVNPWLTVIWQQSTGYETNASGQRSPTFAQPVTTTVQWQALASNDLVQLEGINLNNERNVMYINGNVDGVGRPDARGGDLITVVEDGSVWKVVFTLENWNRTSGWTKAVVTRQSPQSN